MKHRTTPFAALILLAVLLAACGGSDDSDSADTQAASAPPPLTGAELAAQRSVLAAQGVNVEDPDEVRYLSAIDTAWDEFSSRNASAANEVNTQEDDPERAQVFQIYLDAGAGQAFAEVYAAAQTIDPPTAYEADFAAVNSYLADLIDADVAFADALTAGDLVGVTLANLDLALAAAGARGRLAPSTCTIIFGESCPPPAPENAGPYVRTLRLELSELSEALPLVAGIFLGSPAAFDLELSPEEDVAVAAGVIERGLRLVGVLSASVNAFDATDEFAADHNVLVVLLDDLEAILQESAMSVEDGTFRGDQDRPLADRLLAGLCLAVASMSDETLESTGFSVMPGPDDTDLCETGFPDSPPPGFN